ncbi:MAG: NAD(+)/NADH kinase, partial [Clostridia bacterium]|nr:NAD(+)/NADH kinase [Clostridia bacterium]
AEPCARLNIPIMGINLGKIGFMTEIEVEDIENAVVRLLSGDYKIEERMMMQVDICRNDGSTFSYYALNDAVISKPDAQMISLELYREDEKINEYIADGVIISTPTGSTGYSLSAGGPVADPGMEMFITTPICAHMLSSRTAILPSNRTVSLKLTEAGNRDAVVTIDGQVKEHISHYEKIKINKWDKNVKLIKMGEQSFYDILTKKLS